MTRFARRLLRWYSANARKLPWRDHARPYEVWISEVMLQQTRVATVVPYFLRWIKVWPSIRSLARAPERRVLQLWEGLGYYSRARNLLKTAKILMEQYDGVLPAEASRLHKLPGIGRYTAAAVSSIAFGMDEPTLDGNIRRVLARVFNVGIIADSPAGTRALWKLAREHMPKGRAGEFNQALMDLGALVCLPTSPHCRACPVNRICDARRLGKVDRLPLRRPAARVPHYLAGAAVIRRRGNVLLAHRPPSGLLGGMWEFPNVRMGHAPGERGQRTRGFAAGLRELYGLKVERRSLVGTVTHAYTHFRVTVRAYACDLTSRGVNAQLRWVARHELATYPMGRIDRQITKYLDD